MTSLSEYKRVKLLAYEQTKVHLKQEYTLKKTLSLFVVLRSALWTISENF